MPYKTSNDAATHIRNRPELDTFWNRLNDQHTHALAKANTIMAGPLESVQSLKMDLSAHRTTIARIQQAQDEDNITVSYPSLSLSTMKRAERAVEEIQQDVQAARIMVATSCSDVWGVRFPELSREHFNLRYEHKRRVGQLVKGVERVLERYADVVKEAQNVLNAFRDYEKGVRDAEEMDEDNYVYVD
ncbi:hypothetical protein BON22_5135 [Cyberlindnera fabianii]|uniref:Uncharacterized protein n=1 Tax=Cyberlindnera fabianii TaxID=36022 RepID=A0A1V2L0B1_CYBFA|nr:hypothetical protein BON22_5135 [Cyberlindnera fabianii]